MTKAQQKKEEEKKETCPCGMNGDCCEKPEIHTPEHECSDESVCEECYGLACHNCSKVCYHEL